MERGIHGETMVIRIDVKNPRNIKVTNEKEQPVNPVVVEGLLAQPYNGVYHVNSAAILGRKENPYCVIFEIFGQLYEV